MLARPTVDKICLSSESLRESLSLWRAGLRTTRPEGVDVSCMTVNSSIECPSTLLLMVPDCAAECAGGTPGVSSMGGGDDRWFVARRSPALCSVVKSDRVRAGRKTACISPIPAEASDYRPSYSSAVAQAGETHC